MHALSPSRCATASTVLFVAAGVFKLMTPIEDMSLPYPLPAVVGLIAALVGYGRWNVATL